jgi:hypothetical protein
MMSSASRSTPARRWHIRRNRTVPENDDVPQRQTRPDNLNPHSLERLVGCKVEPGLADAALGRIVIGGETPRSLQ